MAFPQTLKVTLTGDFIASVVKTVALQEIVRLHDKNPFSGHELAADIAKSALSYTGKLEGTNGP